MNDFHVPVLLEESVEGLNIQPNGIYADVTFGGGGHSREILKRLGNGKLFGFDQDAAAAGNTISDERFVFINQNFRHLKKMMRLNGVQQLDGILADLGISSYQVDTGERGFAHRLEGPLDMRMDHNTSLTATEIVNTYDEQQLQKMFGEYGEVRNARTLAQKIVEGRNAKRVDTIEAFVTLITPVIKGNRNRYLSQVFQALRITVNDELNALMEFLEQAKELLKPGGRLSVISYHSLEDRIVKNFIRYGNTTGTSQKDFFGHEEKVFKPVNKKPIEPGEAERERNPRSHSARLRVAEKI